MATKRSRRKGHIETQQRTIQTFRFVTARDIAERRPVNRALYTKEEFHKYNMDMYHECSKDGTRIAFEDDPQMASSHGYYIIATDWMSEWRSFANGSGPVPGVVDNRALITKIKRNRIKYNNPESDSDIGLADKKDYYILSVAFFKFFYDTYGCDSIVILKYTTITEEVEINHDPLSTSNAFKKSKPERVQDQPKLVRGREFSAIYEYLEDVGADESLQGIRIITEKLQKMAPQQRAAREEAEIERLKNLEQE